MPHSNADNYTYYAKTTFPQPSFTFITHHISLANYEQMWVAK